VTVCEAFAMLAPPSPVGREAGEHGHEPASFGAITTEGVTFSYLGSDRVALRDVSLRIASRGRRAGGANGSGKAEHELFAESVEGEGAVHLRYESLSLSSPMERPGPASART
jgi:ABC-type transport system involved in cytochrome bd biosynthesis fused ATPase/permease subunit